jgi:hypothetical protein
MPPLPPDKLGYSKYIFWRAKIYMPSPLPGFGVPPVFLGGVGGIVSVILALMKRLDTQIVVFQPFLYTKEL